MFGFLAIHLLWQSGSLDGFVYFVVSLFVYHFEGNH